MSITEASKKYHEKMFPGYHSKFQETVVVKLFCNTCG